MDQCAIIAQKDWSKQIIEILNGPHRISMKIIMRFNAKKNWDLKSLSSFIFENRIIPINSPFFDWNILDFPLLQSTISKCFDKCNHTDFEFAKFIYEIVPIQEQYFVVIRINVNHKMEIISYHDITDYVKNIFLYGLTSIKLSSQTIPIYKLYSGKSFSCDS